MKFTNEQARLASNLSMLYSGWIAQERTAPKMPEGRLAVKVSADKSYLYLMRRDGRGNGTSLGPLGDPENQKLWDREQQIKKDAATFAEHWGLYRALKLPVVSEPAGDILRELDRRQLLGLDGMLVVGTNTMGAYEMAAAERFATGLDATEDFDMCWAADKTVTFSVAGGAGPILGALKAVDSTYTVNMERQFQALNSGHFEVEVLVAPSRVATYPAHESLRPDPNLHEQEWLLKGRPVDEVLMDRSGKPCRLVVPDPRWMALHKLWLSAKPTRDQKKKEKDRKQGLALLQVLPHGLPHYPLNDEFWAQVPAELQQYRPEQT